MLSEPEDGFGHQFLKDYAIHHPSQPSVDTKHHQPIAPNPLWISGPYTHLDKKYRWSKMLTLRYLLTTLWQYHCLRHSTCKIENNTSSLKTKTKHTIAEFLHTVTPVS